MLLSLHVGFVVTYNLQKKVVMRGKQILQFYLTSGHAVLDMLSVIPWFAQARLVNSQRMPTCHAYVIEDVRSLM